MKLKVKKETKQDDCEYIDREAAIRFLEEKYSEKKDFRHMSTDNLLMYSAAVMIAEQDAKEFEAENEKYNDLKCPEGMDRKFKELLDKYYPQEK